ncbi:MAG TPA: heme ABC exporter ATP-binding protein CcmA [Gemmatimonadaceae bacterium]|nr:heme ABC exporter ATP-binding protein CcmA [Gemmatimonadaceae bacterium]
MPHRAADSSPGLAIDAQGVARRFGSQWVLRGVTLQVSRGEVVGLLGANGSGKSTLLRILATLLRPNAGQATVCGYDAVREADDVRGSVGFLAHSPGLYDDLSARENLLFALAMLRPAVVGAAAVDSVLARVGLAALGDARVRGFSAGMQRRLALARLLLAQRAVLLLDEPYSNLDGDGISLMNGTIAETVRGGGAALIVLHERAPAASILHRTVTIRDGRISAARAPSARTQLSLGLPQ